jgi:5-methylthioadenosine/S-adenosylhomocysteine deaminase
VGPDDDVPRPEAAAVDDFPDAVVLPGLVNVHTHLELTTLSGAVADEEFFDWIRHVRRAKEGLSPEEFLAAAEQGVRDAWACGITTVADTGDSGAVVDALSRLGGRGVVFQEVFGPHPDQAADAISALESRVAELAGRAGSTVAVGVSPHAPYTVSPALYGLVADLAIRESLPVALHIAESTDEVALLTRGEGPFATLWQCRGIPEIQTARSPIAFLERTGILETAPLAIHAVQTDDEDLAILHAHHCGIALCLQSNSRHGHGLPPVKAMFDRAMAVGVGTDSVASVESLDLLADVRMVAERAGLGAAEALRLATAEGARALGFDGEIGTLDPGKWADLCVLGVGSAPAGLAERILQGRAEDVLATYVAGRRVYEGRAA